MNRRTREYIMLLEFVHGTTQTVLAERFNLSRQRVHQIILGVMERLHVMPLTPKEIVGNLVMREIAGTGYSLDGDTPEGFYYVGQLVRSDPEHVFKVYGGRKIHGPFASEEI